MQTPAKGHPMAGVTDWGAMLARRAGSYERLSRIRAFIQSLGL
jgi:hypothetical protein